MTDADRPFIDAVVAAPDDDLPRILFADRLAETYYLGPGREERAEFIRVQVELARLEPPGVESRGTWATLERINALQRRERVLLGSGYSYRWFPVGGLYHPALTADGVILWYGAQGRIEGRMYRGFVSAVTCAAADWLAHADALLAAAPIRRVWRDDEHHPGGAWCGDGVVRLRSMPEVEDDGRLFSSRRVRLLGRETWHRWAEQDCHREEIDAHGATGAIACALLRREFVGVRFEPPPALSRRADEEIIRGIVGQITGVAAADWNGPSHTTPLADIRRVMRAMEGVAAADRAEE